MNKTVTSEKQTKRLSWGISIAAVILLFSTVVIFITGRQKEWMIYQQQYYSENSGQDSRLKIITITPALTGKPEMCLTCHQGIEEISSSHPVESFGCTVCHGGNGDTLNKELSHKYMRGGKNPSALTVAGESCGTGPEGIQCHNGFNEEWRNMVYRVERSLQATYAGAIAVVQYTYNIPRLPKTRYGVKQVTDSNVRIADFPDELTGIHEKIKNDQLSGHLNPIEQKFVTNCINNGCHLYSEAPPEKYFYRSQGCAACHVTISKNGLYMGNDVTISKSEAGHMEFHKITTAIPYRTCNACHNRGIYSMRQMQFLKRTDLATDDIEPNSPESMRRKEYYHPMTLYAKCELTLDCLDCHTHNEIMGNGDIFPDKKTAVETRCLDCHGTIESEPASDIIESPDQSDAFIAGKNPYITSEAGDVVAVTKKGTLRPSVKKVSGIWQMVSKVDGKTYFIPIVKDSSCKQNVEEQEALYCQGCHDTGENSKIRDMKK
jgi:hypothetical protein